MLMQAVKGNLQTVKPVRKLGVQKEELVKDKGGTTKGNAQKCHKEICMYVFIFQLT